jgi:AraC-like DNA-binding protein
MIGVESRALLQRFLPGHDQHAFVWKYAHAIGGRRPRHFHGEPELNQVVRGSATFGVGDRVVRATQGALLAFPSGQDHVLLAASPDLYLYAIGLEREYSADVLGPAHEPVVPLHVGLGKEELESVVDRAAAIVERSGSDQPAAELWERVHWLGRRAAPSSTLAAHVLTRRALQLMASAPELGLGALARETRAHPSEISRHFHRDMGMTLVRYRARLRLLRLIRIVDRGEHDVMVAAILAGFGSYSQCHRTFRAEFACSPREFFCSEVRDRMQLAYAG